MKGSWLCYMVGVTSLFLGLSVLMEQTSAYVTSFPDEPDIDGKLITVGIAIAKYLAGLIPYPGVSALIIAIIDAWSPKPGDNYWEQIRENVAEMCGEFINDHNLKQVEVYKSDLIDLLHRYDRAPVISDGTYPDKNMMANALHTSILTNRFLIEAAEMPWSMSIDFVDVSNVHVLILKDAAETYSSPGQVSKWWHDLSNELYHYIKYGMMLQNVTMDWRNCQIECRIDRASQACLDFRWMGITCYDKFEIIDHVNDHREACSQIHPDNPDQGSCVHFCQNYQTHIDQSSQKWFYENVGSVVHEMEVLKVKADEMAKHVSVFYNTYNEDKY
ncbi:uncharacterized protein [Palaemon carinicauda]|uniref:uncharacterized protein isoform X2 n=1 Tax=Palaemon carinicauda TaxID=392227 RepID=UPI0035B5C83E